MCKLSTMTETKRKWADRVRQWRDSGQPAERFAQEHGFAASTLRWWSYRLSGTAAASPVVAPTESPGASSAAPAEVPAEVRMVRVVRTAREACALTVRVGAAQVEVRSGFDPSLLRELVDALGGEP
jgi:hypothetical protein